MTSKTMEGLEDQFFDPKKENLSYTTALIKPQTCLKQENIQEIIDLIEGEKFIIKSMLNRPLLRQEVINLFYKHQQQSYFTQILNYMMSSPCVIFLLCHQTEDPIAKWKGMIGNKDPVEAKKNEANSLRAKYGIDIIKNEFHGSDDPFHANKERDIFRFPIPQKIPEFKHNQYKIPQELLFKWLYPPKLEHPYVNNRLDLFGLYGPALNWHSVDYCFCKNCMKIGKAYLEKVKEDKINEEKQKLGLNTMGNANSKHTTMSKSKVEDRLMLPPIRLINEDGIESLWKDLCENCRKHCEMAVHLCSGQAHLHIMTESEIRIMGEELNKNELLNLLIIEKGQAAKIMIEEMSLIEPKELLYGKELVYQLIKDLPTDYYKRYEFNDLQQVIMEDRRIRMNAWVSSIISKPIDRFKNPKLLDQTVSPQENRNLKSVHFTLQRTLPLSMTYKKEEISHTPVEFEASIVDKKKLQSNEEGIVRVKKLHRYLHQYVTVDTNSKYVQQDFVNGLNIQRPYNPGRNGSWNNYCCLQKDQKKI